MAFSSSVSSSPVNFTLPSSSSGSSIKKPIKAVSKPCFGCDCGDEMCDCCICTVMWWQCLSYYYWCLVVTWYDMLFLFFLIEAVGRGKPVLSRLMRRWYRCLLASQPVSSEQSRRGNVRILDLLWFISILWRLPWCFDTSFASLGSALYQPIGLLLHEPVLFLMSVDVIFA